MDTIPSFQNMKHLDPEKEKPQEDEAEEMHHMFEGQGPYSEEFSVGELSQPTGSAVWKPGYVDDDETQTREVEGNIRVRDTDLKLHRRDSFPHVHHPLKPASHYRHRKGSRRRGHKHHQGEGTDEDEEEAPAGAEAPDKKLSIVKEAMDTGGGIGFVVGDPNLEEGWSTGRPSKRKPPPPQGYRPRTTSTDDEQHMEMSPLLPADVAKLRSCIRYETDTAGSEDEVMALVAPPTDHSNDGKKGGRVQFDIGSDAADSEYEHKPKPHRKRRSHRSKNKDVEDPSWRLQTGSEKNAPLAPFTFTTTEDEANQLKEHDLNNISTHRFEDKTVHRRHTLRAKSAFSSFFHPSQDGERERDQPSTAKGKDKIQIIKKTYDHNPHEVFVELAELQPVGVGGALEWKETARWIKYEEDVEGADNRWGKPHIAFLNFNALFSLRKGLERGAILLDLDESDLSSIAARVVDHMVACDQIPPDQRDAVVKILLLRHKHIKERENAFRRASRGSRMHLLGSSADRLPTSQSTSSFTDQKFPASRRSLVNMLHATASFTRRSSMGDGLGTPVANGVPKPSRANSFAHVPIDIDSDAETPQREKRVMNLELLKKLPEGAEATAVLVGAVDFLKQPTIAFVRLAQGVEMENIIEVPLPVRFLFVLLGPLNGDMDYHEVGRSISTLMSDKSFHEVAYKAHSRGQLLTAINDFLNASIVFPPSEWRNKDLVPIDEIRAKSHEIRRKNEDMKMKKKMAAAMRKEEPLLAVTDGGEKRPPGDEEEGEGGHRAPPKRDPLARKGVLFYGLAQDVKFRYSQYLSDFRDGLSPQVLSACIFIFFAALSPAITFGGMYGDLTGKYIGVGETLLVSSINGVIFALFACQPIIIVGSTGPLMIFDMSLLSFCTSMEIDYLSTRAWVGIWILVIGLLVVAFEALAVVKKISRFTEEIFSTLVCIIFIYGAFEKLYVIFKKHPLSAYYPPPPGYNTSGPGEVEEKGTDGNVSSSVFDGYDESLNIIPDDPVDYEAFESTTPFNLYDLLDSNSTLLNATTTPPPPPPSSILTNQPNTALLSMCLMLGTFIIAWKLKKFRNSKFLGRGVRRALGDFGVPISIFLMVLLDVLIQDTYTDKLSMPKGLKPSNSSVRGWLISPFGVVTALPVWVMIAAAPAAILLFVLIFLEENICGLILSKPERCLKKGSGFHMDLILSCLINTISGFLGAPFMGPACVRTIAHMSSLTVMSSNVAPGESPKIVGCIEQRVSPLVVSILVGMAVMLYSVLNLVPTAVLLGIFLYMGISATAGIQLLERVILFFMPVKHHPNVPYVKRVRTRKMHVFTLVQVVMLAVLWVVKQSPAALAIPFVLLLLIPIRLYLLPIIFTPVELCALDGGAEDSSLMDDSDSEPDFYETAHDLPSQIDLQHHAHQS